MKKLFLFLSVFFLLIGSASALPDEWGRGVNNPTDDFIIHDVKELNGFEIFLNSIFRTGEFSLIGLQQSYSPGQTISVRVAQESLKESCSGPAYVSFEVYDAPKDQQTRSHYKGGGSFKLRDNLSPGSFSASFTYTLPSSASGTWSASGYIDCPSKLPRPASEYSSVTEQNFNVISTTTPVCSNECTSGQTKCETQFGFNNRYVGTCGNYDTDTCTDFQTTNLIDCGGANLCSNGQCVSPAISPPSSFEEGIGEGGTDTNAIDVDINVLGFTVKPSSFLRDPVSEFFSKDLKDLKPGDEVDFEITVRNDGTTTSSETLIEAAVYPTQKGAEKELFSTLGLFSAFTQFKGTAGNCEPTEDFVRTGVLKDMKPGEEKTFKINVVKIPDQQSFFGDGTSAFASDGRYTLAVTSFDGCRNKLKEATTVYSQSTKNLNLIISEEDAAIDGERGTIEPLFRDDLEDPLFSPTNQEILDARCDTNAQCRQVSGFRVGCANPDKFEEEFGIDAPSKVSFIKPLLAGKSGVCVATEKGGDFLKTFEGIGEAVGATGSSAGIIGFMVIVGGFLLFIVLIGSFGGRK